jgi:CHAT domain-containing protein
VANDLPLVENVEISYLPSASSLTLIRSISRDQAGKAVAVLADPVFDLSDPRIPVALRSKGQSLPGEALRLAGSLRDIGDIGSESSDFKLSRLRYTGKEAMAIADLAPRGTSLIATDFRANRTTALDPTLSQYRSIHFATHSILNDVHPELSGIVLSMVNERGEPQNGYLGLSDIFALNLPVDMVVLSACRTGIGKEIKGEGLIGLTRGFLYSGASKVVASLWKVDDEATADFMKRFYRNLLEKRLAPSAALRQAKIEMRQVMRWRAPYYWAGFILQGDWK